jgi:hypothetical protein
MATPVATTPLPRVPAPLARPTAPVPATAAPLPITLGEVGNGAYLDLTQSDNA